MKRKLGILTYHSAVNYGAALQCYALKSAICNLGNEAKVLNLITPQQEKNNSLFRKRKGLKNIAMQCALFPFINKRIAKNNKFKSFQEKYFECTERVKNEKEFKVLLEKNNFHEVVVGSDQVWCPFIEDFTNNFFIPFNIDIIKIGYAVSIGRSKENDLLPFKKYIDKFSYIGVREKSAINVLKGITQNELTEVVDPTLLLNQKEWDAIAATSNIRINKPYLICYFLKKERFDVSYDLAKQIAKERNLDIYFINQRYSKYSFLKNTIYDAGPEDFVALIKNASCVCTDSFHGTLFSIIFQRDFYTFIESKEGSDRRRQDVLSNLNLMDRCVYLDDVKILNTSLNYEKVENNLNIMRNDSLGFLKFAIVGKDIEND